MQTHRLIYLELLSSRRCCLLPSASHFLHLDTGNPTCDERLHPLMARDWKRKAGTADRRQRKGIAEIPVNPLTRSILLHTTRKAQQHETQRRRRRPRRRRRRRVRKKRRGAKGSKKDSRRVLYSKDQNHTGASELTTNKNSKKTKPHRLISY